MTQRLDFSYNWNEKLNCIYFTTLRLSSRFNKGDRLEIYLKGVLITNNATIVEKKKILMKDINIFIAGLDTGYEVEECKNILKTMYKNKDINWDTQPLFLYLIKQEFPK